MKQLLKTSLILLVLILSTNLFFLQAQNLIVNGSFEDNTGIPDAFGQWWRVNNWDNVNGSMSLDAASPDYLHTAASVAATLPVSNLGTVNPFEGDAIMCVAAWGNDFANYREYLSSTLSEPLAIGNTYLVSFYVTNGTVADYGGVGSNGLQVYFSVGPLSQITTEPINITPHYVHPVFYNTEWQQVTFEFTPTQNVDQITIGNFYSDENTELETFVTVANPYSLYFIDEVSVQLNSFPVSVSNDTSICVGASVDLFAQGSDAYTWVTADEPDIVLSSSGSFTVSPETTTVYNVISNNFTASVTVNVFEAPEAIDLGPDVWLCVDDSITLGNEIAGITNYVWNPFNVGPTFEVGEAGTYWLEVNNVCGSARDTIVINQHELTLNLGPDTALCTVSTYLLDANINLPNATPDIQYEWQDGSSNPTFTATTTGWYWAAVTDTCGYTVRDSVWVSISPSLGLDLGQDAAICAGNTIVLNASIPGINSYVWQDGAIGPAYVIDAPGVYWVQAENNCGATERDTIRISTYNTTFENGLSDIMGICATTESATTILDATSASASEYLWSNGASTASITVQAPGLYWVRMSNVCETKTDTVLVQPYSCEPPQPEACGLVMPTAFSPNADGLNDDFKPKYYCEITNYELLVYDRWGKTVFTSNMVNKSWDGFYKGQKCVMGTYAWYATYQLVEEAETTGEIVISRPQIKKGAVTLLR